MICQGWEGRTVDGKFPLLESLGGSADECVFLTIRQGIQTASIKLIRANGADADAYLARCDSAKALSHRFLLHIMDTGRDTIEGTALVYVVTERTEGTLSGIPRNALDATKVRGFLEPIVDALAFIHDKGLVHGNVKPANIVLVGEQWKLASDDMVGPNESAPDREPDTYDAPEFSVGKMTSASDMWSLGMIVVETCAQRTPVWDRTAIGDLGIPDWLPQPFRQIARECLVWDPAQRISIAKVKSLLTRDLPPSQPPVSHSVATALEETPTAPAATATASEATMEGVPAAEERSSELQEAPVETPPDTPWVPDEVDRPELTPRPRLFANLGEEEEPRSRKGVLLFAIVLLAVISILAVRGYRSKFPPATKTPSASAGNQPSAQSQAAKPPESHTAPAGQPEAQNPSQPATPQESQSPPPSEAVSPSQKPLEAQTAPAETRHAPEAQAPASSPVKKAPSDQETEAPKSKEEVREPRVANAEGAVLKRVLPNVSPGANESMRRPILVDVRVAVNESGTVANAAYMTQGPGNYFARTARQAAYSWKFKPPRSNGQPKASVWRLRFLFERNKTEVTATEIH